MIEALSAATTICAHIRGDHDEATASKWHTEKVGDCYMLFSLVILSAYKKMHRQVKPVMSDYDEDNLDRAFARFKPGMLPRG